MQGKWKFRTLLAALTVAGLAMHGIAMADHDDDSDRRYQKHRYDQPPPNWYRHKPTPFSYYGHDGHSYRVYPRSHPRHRRWRQRGAGQYRYYRDGYRPYYESRHEHYHRHRPILEIYANFDRYTHCPGHGGYFRIDDIYYH